MIWLEWLHTPPILVQLQVTCSTTAKDEKLEGLLKFGKLCYFHETTANLLANFPSFSPANFCHLWYYRMSDNWPLPKEYSKENTLGIIDRVV